MIFFVDQRVIATARRIVYYMSGRSRDVLPDFSSLSLGSDMGVPPVSPPRGSMLGLTSTPSSPTLSRSRTQTPPLLSLGGASFTPASSPSRAVSGGSQSRRAPSIAETVAPLVDSNRVAPASYVIPSGSVITVTSSATSDNNTATASTTMTINTISSAEAVAPARTAARSARAPATSAHIPVRPAPVPMASIPEPSYQDPRTSRARPVFTSFSIGSDNTPRADATPPAVPAPQFPDLSGQ